MADRMGFMRIIPRNYFGWAKRCSSASIEAHQVGALGTVYIEKITRPPPAVLSRFLSGLDLLQGRSPSHSDLFTAPPVARASRRQVC